MPREQSEYQKTFNDVLMQVAGPTLIMMLVGSLVFFLLHVLYQGDYPARVNYVFGLFVFAAVLISRISIEEGFERASFYGLALAIAVFIVSNFFLTASGALAPFTFIINGTFIAFIWWCASRLTWDCTVNDSSRDVSATGLVELFRRKITLSKNDSDAESETEEVPAHNNPQSYDDLLREVDEEEDLTKATWDRKLLNIWPFKRKKNTPGLWIFYFSLIAIPIFGIGQAFIPSTSTGDRRYAFMLFVMFVVAVLGLLMMTSLMGLQRYLKKRNTAMPDSIAKTWMIVGALFGIAVLSVAWLLPRPAPEYSFTQLLPKWTTPDRRTSSWAPGNDGKQKTDSSSSRTEKSENAKQTKSSKDSKNSGGNAESKKASGGKSGEKKSGKKSGGSKGKQKSKSGGGEKSKSGKKSSGGEKSKSGKKSNSDQSKSDSSKNKNDGKSKSDPNKMKSDRPKKTETPAKNSLEEYDQKRKNDPEHWKKKNSGNSSPSQRKQSQKKSSKNSSSRSSTPPPPPPSGPPPAPSMGFLAILLKWVFIIIILAIIIFVATKYRKELLASLRTFIAEIKEFFAKLFGNKESEESTIETTPDGRVVVPVKQFHEYSNPFESGAAKKMTDEQLVSYTFEAFTAWGRIFGCVRVSDQTPHEYVRQLARAQKALGKNQMDEFANLVCQVLFGPPDSESNSAIRPPLQTFWKTMQDNAYQNSPASALAPA